MKLFISWSGDYSKAIAEALANWLGLIFSGLPIFISTESIRKGKRWRTEIAKALQECNFGIACLTPDNFREPWLMYESGALAKLPDSALYTLLVGLKPADLYGSPLDEFNHTPFIKEEFFKLVSALNEAQGATKHKDPNLKTLYDTFFPKLEEEIAKAKSLAKKGAPAPTRPSVEEMFEVILENTGMIAKRLESQFESGSPGMSEELKRLFASYLAPPNTPSLYRQRLRRVQLAPEQLSLNMLDLPLSVFQEITGYGVKNLGELAIFSRGRLKELGMDEASINRIEAGLAKFGLELRPDPPSPGPAK